MIDLSATCTYCDFRWELKVYSESSINRVVCPRCGDKNKKIKRLGEGKIDTYVGCPPFKELDQAEIDDIFEHFSLIDS